MSSEGPEIPDVRNGTESEQQVFGEFINNTFSLWLINQDVDWILQYRYEKCHVFF